MAGLTSLGLVLCVVGVMVFHAQGETWLKITQPETVHGKLVFFCEYKGIRLLPNSRFKDYDDCARCTCDTSGQLSCASLRVVVVSYGASDCMLVQIGCRNKWVLISDRTKKCPKKRIPPHYIAGR